jgi:hypothetical protein
MAADRREWVALSPVRHRSSKIRLRGRCDKVGCAVGLILDGAVKDALGKRLRLLVCRAFRIKPAGIVARTGWGSERSRKASCRSLPPQGGYE